MKSRPRKMRGVRTGHECCQKWYSVNVGRQIVRRGRRVRFPRATGFRISCQSHRRRPRPSFSAASGLYLSRVSPQSGLQTQTL